MFLILIKKLIAKKILINFKRSYINNLSDPHKMERIGVLNSNISMESNQILLKKLIEIMPIDVKIQTMTFYENTKEILNIETGFSHQSFNLFCAITDNNLNTFLSNDFDLLINFYPNNQPFLELISQGSKSKFKVGLSAKNFALNSFIVETNVDQPDEFAFELQKYLKLMHKI